ncbi:glycoside hydrolase family 10 protein [Maribacter sp. HTCC2170]|uniref:glycoside hydrolase family 10 protein n=1 Tax=Maribacter sp. (strain HTCC2170 / KCCM 42371) TaxID=313603 RepID=UPI00006B4938|nr:family 10 glycosylhydrolase [Maribacter sp. HTCC2170]EAR01051.1 FenI [Maribacter sp. HTCC2170]
MLKKISHYLLLLIIFNSCDAIKPIPQPRTEFRGVWVATVVNIDWPKNGLDAIEKQKADFLKILEFYDQLNFNTVIVQVRTAGDSFYDSKYAPWSRFLTGTEGKSTEGHFDMLNWMIDQTHNRGFEFHAWLNPYRATFDLKTDVLSATHDFNLHPEWMLKYGNKYYYNPGLPEVRERLASIMGEVVTKYDIDAIHFDDYFYPYRIKDEIFNDSLAYNYHSFSGQTVENWRRSNIDSLVKNIHSTVKNIKPWVQFGISPFGVWKNKSTDPRGSDTKAGQTTYEDLYADPLTWMNEGWIDYLVPQVYWSMDLPVASHKKIVNWWSNNSVNTNLYIGNGAYKIRSNSDKAWDDKKEMPNQLKLARKDSKVQGNVLFSAKSLMNDNPDVVEYLKRRFYKNAALPPISPMAKVESARQPQLLSIETTSNGIEINLSPQEDNRFAMVYSSGKKNRTEYPLKRLLEKLPVNENKIILPKTIFKDKKYIALSVINYYGQESEPILILLNQRNDSKE